MRHYYFIYSRLFICLCIIICCITSCTENKLTEALDFAGDNRGELEKVLMHYKNDPLKYKAACFLIENMPQHYSYVIPYYDKWKKLKIKAVLGKNFSKKDSLKAQTMTKELKNLKIMYDSKIITADYLIKNIDFSFKIWNERSWKNLYSFDEFCQSILPYRIDHEPLQWWKEAYYNKYSHVLDSLYNGNDVVKCCDALVRYVTTIGFPNNYKIPTELPAYDAIFLKDYRIGGCKESSDYIIYIMRALGIPANLDFIYYSDNYSCTHYWNSIRSPKGIIVPFWVEDNPKKVNVHVGLNDDEIRPKWKIYRKSYKIQKKDYPSGFKDHYLLSVFKDPSIEDVTAQYYGKNNITINSFVTDTLVFLTRHYLLPVDVAKAMDWKATFYNIAPNLVYFLYYYSKDIADSPKAVLTAANYPFIFNGKRLYYFVPNEQKIMKITLTRKTALNGEIIKHLDSITGFKIESIKSPNSLCGVPVIKIKNNIRTNYNNFILSHSITTRYMKCSVPANTKIEIGELTFFGDTENKDTIKYSVLFADSSSVHMYDNDPLSYYEKNKFGGSICIDFHSNRTIKKIQLIPRNDDNFIRIGDEYELFYHIGKGWGWKSLGKKIATTNNISFYAPDNSVLWLKDNSRGNEEQLFYYKNGKQIFLR